MLAPISNRPATATGVDQRGGFTLIEVLVVIAVLATLMGVLTPMYSIVNSWTIKARTQFVLKKADTGLRLFHADFGVYPYTQSYPDSAQDLIATSPNELYYHIGKDIAPTDAAFIRDDMAMAETAFIYRWSNGANLWGGSLSELAQASPLTFTIANSFQAYVDRFKNESSSGAGIAYGQKVGVPTILNRMAQERVRLAVLAGDVDIRGPIVCTLDDRSVAVNHSGTRLLPSPASAARPGWAKDYVQGDIEQRYIQGDTILDGWRHPLVYICQATPGCLGAGGYVGRSLIMPFDSRFFGLGPAGFHPTTGPGPALVNSRPLLLTSGRLRLTRGDAGDNLGPTPTDPVYFPDADRLLDSDVRFYAAPGYETEFELWSAGRDGRFAYRRSDLVNDDNIAVTPYTKGLR